MSLLGWRPACVSLSGAGVWKGEGCLAAQLVPACPQLSLELSVHERNPCCLFLFLFLLSFFCFVL